MATQTRKPSEILREMPREKWTAGHFRIEGYRRTVDGTRLECDGSSYCGAGWLIHVREGDKRLTTNPPPRVTEIADVLGFDMSLMNRFTIANDTVGLDVAISVLEEAGQ